VSRPHRFEPEVYAALKARRHSNREIARLLDVDEASVRRGLKKHKELRRERERKARRERQARWRDRHREEKRATDRAQLLTSAGRKRQRKFRTNEMLSRLERDV